MLMNPRLELDVISTIADFVVKAARVNLSIQQSCVSNISMTENAQEEIVMGDILIDADTKVSRDVKEEFHVSFFTMIQL